MAVETNSKLILANQQLTDSHRINLTAIATNNGTPASYNNPSPVVVTPNPSSPGHDAFGRLRISNPLTLFDSSHRFADNGLWAEDTTGTASSTFNSNAGLMELDVGTASGDEIIRETYKVFSYQPGKSLLIMTTFVLAAEKENLRQRVGYFGENNGFYLELDNSTLSLVKRSATSGSVVNIKVSQENWNFDKLDGTGPSGKTLDISKGQILWTDIEWLGMGSIRMGFVIDGQFIPCHIFHHANIIDVTYITTASLPLRQELTNTGITTSVSKAKQVCATVISEGGYDLGGAQRAAIIPITTPKELTSADTYYPVISLKLKSGRQDAIVIPTALSFVGITSAVYNWQIVKGGASTAGTWVSAGVDSSVEYNLTGTAFTGGRILASGYLETTNQSSAEINLQRDALFKFQLERDGLAGVSSELTLVIASDTAGATCYATMDWEEVTR